MDTVFTNDPPVEIVQDDGTVLTRKGYCNGCGWCCQVIVRARIDAEDIDDKEFAAIRGYPVEAGEKKWYDHYEPCPLLSADNRCTIYAGRPRTCREFPTSPLLIEESPCTYWFEDEDGNKV